MTNSNPPSSRPMTLRQQLERLIGKLELKEGSDASDVLDAVETLCQEIAREARLDELDKLDDFLDARDVYKTFTAGVVYDYQESRVAELTQKPPQPLADMQSDTSPKADSNQVDNSEEA